MKALVIGATGSTGEFLVDELLKDINYSSVVVFSRRTTKKVHPKLTEHLVDFSNFDSFQELIIGDVFFSCLGTTLKAAGSKEKQWEIDFDIPAKFARIAKDNKVNSCVLVSSVGASSSSSVFYSKMKGQLEENIAALDFKQYVIFRPGPLVRKGTDRNVEKIMINVFKIFNKVGLFKKYKPLETELLAQKLAKAPVLLPSGKTVIEAEQVFEF